MSNINDSVEIYISQDTPGDENTTTDTAESQAAPAGNDAVQDKIQIADEVISQIISIAAGKTEGVSIPVSGVGEGIAGLFGMKSLSRGIRIETDEKNINVDISIAVEYGYKINEIAKKLQDEIRNDLIEMTGLIVGHVNVHVVSISTKEQVAIKSPRHARQQQKEADAAAAEGAGGQKAQKQADAATDSQGQAQPQGQTGVQE